MTRVLILGSEGIVGQRLKSVFPDAVGMDISGNPDIKADLLNYPDLPDCDVIVLLACSSKNPNDAFEKLQSSLRMAEFVVLHAISQGIPIVFASSVWAEIHPLNAYGCVKRCIEQMVDSHGGASIRLGWVGYTQEDWDSAPELRPLAWTDDQCREAFRSAVDRVTSSGCAKKSSAELRSAALDKLREWRIKPE